MKLQVGQRLKQKSNKPGQHGQIEIIAIHQLTGEFDQVMFSNIPEGGYGYAPSWAIEQGWEEWIHASYDYNGDYYRDEYGNPR